MNGIRVHKPHGRRMPGLIFVFMVVSGLAGIPIMYGHGTGGTGSNPASGSCLAASAVSAMVTGTNVVSYVAKGAWVSLPTAVGVAVVNVEGSSITPQVIATTSVVNSCASNPKTGKTVCTANNNDVYVISGTTLKSNLNSSATGIATFFGGTCTNCGVVMDPVRNRALLALSLDLVSGFQFLNLDYSPSFEPAFASQASGATRISQGVLFDPVRNLILSPNEFSNYEIVSLSNMTHDDGGYGGYGGYHTQTGGGGPAFFENVVPPYSFGSAGEDCSTGIALAGVEVLEPSHVFLADLTQATFTPDSPAGTWDAPSRVQILSESILNGGANAVAVAEDTHIGILTGRVGNSITAFKLPKTSGTGIPAITDWVTCNLPNAAFLTGIAPQTVTAYKSPNGGSAVGLVADFNRTTLGVIDLTKMLNPAFVPRTPAVLGAGGHGCLLGTLPASVVRTVPVP
jgi:hypothetical protein